MREAIRPKGGEGLLLGQSHLGASDADVVQRGSVRPGRGGLREQVTVHGSTAHGVTSGEKLQLLLQTLQGHDVMDGLLVCWQSVASRS